MEVGGEWTPCLRQDTAEGRQTCASPPQRLLVPTGPGLPHSAPDAVVCREPRAQSEGLDSIPHPSRQVFSAQGWLRVKPPVWSRGHPVGVRVLAEKVLDGDGGQ